MTERTCGCKSHLVSNMRRAGLHIGVSLSRLFTIVTERKLYIYIYIYTQTHTHTHTHTHTYIYIYRERERERE